MQSCMRERQRVTRSNNLHTEAHNIPIIFHKSITTVQNKVCIIQQRKKKNLQAKQQKLQLCRIANNAARRGNVANMTLRALLDVDRCQGACVQSGDGTERNRRTTLRRQPFCTLYSLEGLTCMGFTLEIYKI